MEKLSLFNVDKRVRELEAAGKFNLRLLRLYVFLAVVQLSVIIGMLWKH